METAILEASFCLLVGIVTAWLGLRRVAQIRAPRHWTPIMGRVVDHVPDAAKRPLDVVEYALPEGGTHRVVADAHGVYPSGRPTGTSVQVWRDPKDALNAVLELPTVDRFAGPATLGALGLFFGVGGIVWLVLLLVLK